MYITILHAIFNKSAIELPLNYIVEFLYYTDFASEIFLCVLLSFYDQKQLRAEIIETAEARNGGIRQCVISNGKRIDAVVVRENGK